MADQEIYVPNIEELIPLPERADSEPLNPSEELAMRVRTIKLISDLSGTPISPSDEQREEAIILAKGMSENPALHPEFGKYKNETLAYLAGLVAQSNQSIVEELSELKTYVINKLINEVEHASSSKDRINALSRLGEIDGIDAFKRRTETSHRIIPPEEVEKQLLTVLSSLEYQKIQENPVAIQEKQEEISSGA